MEKSSFIDENLLIASYQRLVLAEANLLAGENFEKDKFNSLRVSNYCLSMEIIKEILSGTGKGWEKVLKYLINNGLVVRLGEDCYRTLHMDLLVRASDTRTHPGARQGVILSKFAVVEQAMSTRAEKSILPSKECSLCRELRKAIEEYLGSREGVEIAVEALKDYFRERGSGGYDPYQAKAVIKALRELLNGKKSFVITAPTGAGKTEIFLTVAFLTILRNRVRGRTGKVVLTYPRKMLEIDQMERIIALAKAINNYMRRRGFEEVRVAIRDGDTREVEAHAARQGKTEFRGIKCGDGKLYAVRKDGRVRVVCSKDGSEEEYGFIVAEMREVSRADVVVTNFSTLSYRLTYSGTDDLGVHDLSEADLIVIDEAHEYDSIALQNIKHTLGMLSMLSHIAGSDSPAIIISSATLFDHVTFAKELTGREPVDLSFHLLTTHDELKGRRLIIYLVVMMSPFVSWQSYISELATIILYLHWRYRREGKSFVPQAIAFINNVKEVNRAKSILDNALSLGSPIDNLCTGLHKKYRACREPPNEVPRIFTPYYDLASDKVRITVEKEFSQYGSLYNQLSGLYEIVFSGVPLDKRAKIYEKIKKKELAFVYATTSLELGVDYPGVSFIINAGFDKTERLVQRIGRGGRSPDSMMTVLGIIVAKNNPTDYRKLNDVGFMRSLLIPGMIRGGESSTAVTARLRLLQANAVLRAALMKAIYDGRRLPRPGYGTEEQALASIKELLDALADILRDKRTRSLMVKHLRVEDDVIDEVIADIDSFDVDVFLKWYMLASALDNTGNSLLESLSEVQRILRGIGNLTERVKQVMNSIMEKTGATNKDLKELVEKAISNSERLGSIVEELREKLGEIIPYLVSHINECVRAQASCGNAEDLANLVDNAIRSIFSSKKLDTAGTARRLNYFGAISIQATELEADLNDLYEELMASGAERDIIEEIEALSGKLNELWNSLMREKNNLRKGLDKMRDLIKSFLRGD